MPLPRLLNEAKQRDICAIISVGGSRTLAARYVGCAVDTIRRTAARDAGFAERLSQASATAELGLLKALLTAAKEPKNWRAAAWALERLYPDRYAQRPAGNLTREQATELLAEFAESILVDLPAAMRRKVLERVAEAIVAASPTDLSAN